MGTGGISLDRWTLVLTLLFNTTGTVLGALGGAGLGTALGASATVLGDLVLILIGLVVFLPALGEKLLEDRDRRTLRLGSLLLAVQHAPALADMDRSGGLDWNERLLLSAGLSVNNIGLGVSAGLLSLPPMVFAWQNFVTDGVLLVLGSGFGSWLHRSRARTWLPILTGIGLILYGALGMVHPS